MKKAMPKRNAQPWKTPTLAYRGSVGQILKNGGGKLSITGQDHGEMRCEKPHQAVCS